MTLAPGSRLGRYELERVIGQGGMGVVWSARDPDLDRVIALKVIRYGSDPSLRKRLQREARAMAKLKHPNVLTVYEVASDADRDFIAMELVDGTNLDAWLETKPPHAVVWDALLAAGRGLAAAHAAGLVHRDFKPHNVLRSTDGRVLVTDFGLARGTESADEIEPPRVRAATPVDISLDETITPSVALDETITPTVALDETVASGVSNKPKPDSLERLTMTGALVGTPAYMAPEQFEGASPDPRTDQFAFAVTAWQALTGERPFLGDSVEALHAATSEGLGDRSGGLPAPIHAVLARALDPDPAARWADLDTMLRALERAATARRRGIRMALVGVSLIVISLGVFFATRKPPVDARPPRCPSATSELDPAWSPEIRTKIARKLGEPMPVFEAIANELDAFRAAWITAHDRLCGSPTETMQLGCLRALRDELQTYTELALAHTEPRALFARRTYSIVPRIEVCLGDSALAPPQPPPEHRDEVRAIRAAMIGYLTSPVSVRQNFDTIIERAEKLGWKPLVAEAYESAAGFEQRGSDSPRARHEYERAAQIGAVAGHFRIAAQARLGLLEIEMNGTSDPTSRSRLGDAQKAAAAAVAQAGNDEHLSAILALLDARIMLERGDLENAVERAAFARTTLLTHKDGQRATHALAIEIAARDRDWAPDVESMQRAVATVETFGPDAAGDAETIEAAATVAWLRGDLDAVHRRHDSLSEVDPPVEPDGILRGTVLGPDGKPVANARVVAWTGILAGDASRAYVRPYEVAGAVATTDATGAFELPIMSGAAIVAEQGELRSVPRLAAGAKTLRLVATRQVTGTIPHLATPRPDAIVRFVVGPGASWLVAARIDANGAFAIDHVPPGGELGIRILAGMSTQAVIVRDLTRPLGTFDAIDHAPRMSTSIWVMPGKVLPKTVRELYTRALSAPAFGWGALNQITGDATNDGRHYYRSDDRHGVVRFPRGDVVACFVIRDDEPPACATTKLGDETAFVIP